MMQCLLFVIVEEHRLVLFVLQKYQIYFERFEKIEGQAQVLDDATARLEIITAGDEQLIDDLGAALEELQLDLLRLTRLQELINEQLKPQS